MKSITVTQHIAEDIVIVFVECEENIFRNSIYCCDISCSMEEYVACLLLLYGCWAGLLEGVCQIVG